MEDVFIRGQVWRLWQEYWKTRPDAGACPPLHYKREGGLTGSGWFVVACSEAELNGFMDYLDQCSYAERLRSWHILNAGTWLSPNQWFGCWLMFEVVRG